MKENSIEEEIKRAIDKFSDNKDKNSAILIVENFILGNYILIGGRTNRGYQLLATKNNKQQAIDYAKNLNQEIYDSTLVIEYNKETNTDFPIGLEER